jgi:hypothetical protein
MNLFHYFNHIIMLDDILQEVFDAKWPLKNLKYALLGLGFSVLASVTSFLAMDSFKPRTGQGLFWIIIVFYYVLTIISGICAFLACRNALKSLKTNRDIKNYIALLIGGLLLLGICRQILTHVWM